MLELEVANRLMPEALSWLRRMVEVNSFTENPAGVSRVGELTADLFKDLGFTAEFEPSVNPHYGKHLFLRRRAAAAGSVSQKVILLVTHLDTVYPPEEEVAQNFCWQESDAEGRIYGPGVIDIKGGTVSLWLTLKVLSECAADFFASVDWVIAANASEEVMSQDFADGLRLRCPNGASAVLVFEGGLRGADGNWEIVTARKGRAEYRIISRGRGAHAGSALHEGVNAIVGLSALLPKVANLNDPQVELTVNIGRIHGGTVLNRVPHEAVAELEMRAFDPDVLRRAGEDLLAMQGVCELSGAEISVECMGETPAWPDELRSRELAQCWLRVGELMNLPVKVTSRGGLSDANYLYQLGPTLDGMGPSGGNAHCSERSANGEKVPEFLTVETLSLKAVMNALAIQKIQ